MTGSRRAMGILVTGVGVAVVLAAGSSVVPSAQTRDTVSTETLVQAQAQTQALRDLVAEVRALRGVIEGYTAGQAQSQTLSDLLTVQQRRVAEATTRLDVTRRELEGASAELRRLTADVSDWEDAMRRPPTDAADAARRREGGGQLQQMKRDLDRQSEQEQRLRLRESDLLSALGLEEAKWSELVDRVNRSLAR